MPPVTEELPLPGPPAAESPKEAPTLDVSFSDFASFEECGYRYRLSNVLGFQTQLAPELGYGRAIHHVLRQLAETVRDIGEIPSSDDLNRLAEEEFYMPFASLQAWQTMRKAAKRLVNLYVDSYSTDLHRVWAVERPFALHLDDGIVSGRADVVLDEEGGRTSALAIVDYKVSADESRSARYEEQLQIYSLAGQREGLTVEAAYLHELKDGSRFAVNISDTATTEALASVRHHLGRLRAGQFEPGSRPRALPIVRVSAHLPTRQHRPGRPSKRAIVMAKRTSTPKVSETTHFRHDDARRKNIPTAAMEAEGQLPKARRVKYAYSPHLDSVLRFDPSGRADTVAVIVEKACRGERLDSAEQETLRAVGKNWEQPWLEWAGKARGARPRALFLLILSPSTSTNESAAQAILRNAMRKEAQRSLFAAPEQTYAEAIQFYKHDIDWANRLILGDSLQVMSEPCPT